MQQKFSSVKESISVPKSETITPDEGYLNWLTKLYISTENNQKQIIRLVYILKLDTIPILLQLYSAVAENEIKF